MKRLLLLFAAAVAAASCGGRSQTAETSIVGSTYVGTIPAADAPGIAVELTFTDDNSYTRMMSYLERDAAFRDEGRFTVEDDRVMLHPTGGDPVSAYRIEPGQLRMLNIDGEVIEGPLADYYVLHLKTDE